MLMIPKLQFFSNIASVLELFFPTLSNWCTYDTIYVFWNKEFLIFFVKIEVIKGCRTASDLLEIDLSMEKNLFKVNQIWFGFATEKSLSDLMKKDLVAAKKVEEFMKKCKFLVSML